MKKLHTRSLKGLAVTVSAVAILAGAPAMAQDADCEVGDEDCVDGVATNDPMDSDISQDASPPSSDGAIVVTGSRIRRDDTYSSISPLQVLETDTLQDTGQFDAATLLQQSESAAGQQIDATFQGFVLNNGPGSSTLNLRGLGADRTLILINGRRMAPAGVEGAPTNPSINLLPSSLIERYDLLLDGASSVYGSDAVAGVGNVVLRRDLDGFELFASGAVNTQGGQPDFTISGSWGMSGSNWNFGIGAEFARTAEVQYQDRDYFQGCNRNLEVTESGEFRSIDLASNADVLVDSGGTVTVAEQPCKIQGIVQRIFVNGTRIGSIYFDEQVYPNTGQPGNTGIPFFSESTDAFGRPVDRDGDGVRDVDFANTSINGAEPDTTFLAPRDLYNVMAYGEYTFEGAMNITPFFEVNYSRQESLVRNNGGAQFFPYVPASNPFNPCNINTNPDGVDCRNADNVFNGLVPGSPFFGFRLPTGTSRPVIPIVSVRGDRNNVETVQEQYRGVFGVRGDLPFIGDNWGFEVAGVYSRSEGTSVRRGIREDRLALALGIDPTGDFDNDGVVDNDGDGIADDYNQDIASPPLLAGGACDVGSLRNPNLAAPDLTQGCVPVNMFAPSLYQGTIGDFGTQAERDYLFGTRTFDTTYEQTLVQAYVTGDLFELPYGSVAAVIGGEYRNDTLTSIPDFVASNGLFWGFFADSGATGGKDTWEAFGELDIPLLSGVRFAEDLRINLAGRITDDEFYGTNETYSIKLGWQITPSLLLKGTYGTSFRAPNLRENFLAGQSGFNGVFDPCAVPADAYDGLGGGYNAANDRRAPEILANCRREGRDPTRVGIDAGGLNTIQTSSTEITSGGTFDLDPETSRSWTAGFNYTGYAGPVDLLFNASYYDIEITNAIAEPSAQSIVNDCFTREDGVRSRNCDFIQYDPDPTGRQLVSKVFAGFININRETVRGLDFNATLRTEAELFSENVVFGLNVGANHLLERNTFFITDAGEPDVDEDAGEFGFPGWTGRATFSANVDRLTLTWQTRYVGPVDADANNPDANRPFTDAFGYDRDGNFTGIFADTCLGGGSRDANGDPDGIVAGDGVYCQDVGYADAWFMHTASVRYDADWWELRVGVSNIFDTAPPRVDSARVFSVANTAIGTGYDYNGRRFFGSVRIKF